VQYPIIPPHRTKPSTWLTVRSHFAVNCVGSTGFTVFNLKFHAHGSAKSIKLRHFRDGKELPWILYDEFFDANYQQSRNLDREVTVLAGDHLMVECRYSSEDEVVLYEMCHARLYVYTENNIKPQFLMSQSWVDVNHQMRILGITNHTTIYNDRRLITTVHDPPELAGELREVLSNKFIWTAEIVSRLQNLYKYGVQRLTCSTSSTHYTAADKELIETDFTALSMNEVLQPYTKRRVCDLPIALT